MKYIKGKFKQTIFKNDNGYNVSGGKTNSKEVAAYLEKSLQNEE